MSSILVFLSTDLGSLRKSDFVLFVSQITVKSVCLSVDFFFGGISALLPRPEKGMLYYPCHTSAAAVGYLNFFHTPQSKFPNSIRQNRLRGPPRHSSLGERNQRDWEYIPHRILLGLSSDNLFAATRRAQPALGRPNHYKNQAHFAPPTARLPPDARLDPPREF